MIDRLTALQDKYANFDATELLEAMINHEFNGKIAVSSSFGADAAVTLALVAEINPATPVFFLETGKHFPETLEYVEILRKKLGLQNIIFLKPDAKMLANIDQEGELWKNNPNRCCWLRKVEPLDRAIREMGIEALITGRKKYQTTERAELGNIELDEKGIFKINPIINWSRQQQKDELAMRDLPQHPLVKDGYFSIGCEPCTVPIKAGEDERAGRWKHTAENGTQKTECGLHIKGH